MRPRQTKADQDVVARAHRNFDKAVAWERTARQLYTDDMKFLFADSDNQEQWLPAVRARRQLEGQPMLTVNKTHTHWLHVVNQAKANRPGLHVHPTGSEATYEAAMVFENIIRHIEYASDAQTAYMNACECQVGGGIGYWRIVTDYADDNGFDQEIFIRPVPDPLAVYMSPVKRKDGSDATFCIIYDDMPRAQFEAKYPNVAPSLVGMNVTESGWLTKDSVRIAEYYEVEEGKEWMYAIPNEGGGFAFKRESELSPLERDLLKELATNGEEVRRRRVDKRTIRWYLIAGNQVLERNTWAGKWIPVIRVVGEEIVIDGKMDRKGLVRYLKDPQRMYNYNTSAQVEFGALQTKTPWVGPLEAFEGLENYWATANRENHAYLAYNGMDENGNPIPKPERPQPPQAAEAFTAGMQAAAIEMMMASGQYEATFGKQTQELSGVALDNRKDQGERATFHYLDNLANALRFTGKQLIDLIPKIYDTRRVIRIMGEDGQESQIQVDPQARVALQQERDAENNVIRSIFNPAVGTYDVVAKAGPNFDTRREEAFQAMKELITGVPQLAQVIGDLFAKMGDFPMSDAIAERIRNWIPPEVRGDGATASEKQLMGQLEQAAQIIQQLQQALQDRTEELKIAKQQVDTDALNHLALRMENERKSQIDAFKATTDRLDKLLAVLSPEMLAALGLQSSTEALEAPPLSAGQDIPGLSGAEAYATGLVVTDLGKPVGQP
ncbi:portal protein [Pigmentiphaga daeguensis]